MMGQTSKPTMQDFRRDAKGNEQVGRMGLPGGFLFISHISEDSAAAMEIVEELERRGVRCWIAPRDVRPGRPFDDEIANAIEASQAMLLIFSEHCNDSEYIRREVTVAGESHKVVIPFRIENAEPKHGLRVRLSDLHWLDGFASREQAINEVVRLFPAEKEAVPGAAPERALREAAPPATAATAATAVEEVHEVADAERRGREAETERQKAKEQRGRLLRSKARALWPPSRPALVAVSLIGLAVVLGAIAMWLFPASKPVPVPPTAGTAGTFHFQVCNHSDVQASVATASYVSPTDHRYAVEGWWSVSPGSCEGIGYFPLGTFYTYAEQTNTQAVVWQGNDAELCVQYPGPFRRINTTNYTCQSNERLRGFTKHSVSAGTFTWTLN